MTCATVDVKFTSKVPVVNAARVGTLVTLTIEVSKCDPPELDVDKDQQVSDNGARVAVTEHGRWRIGSIESSLIEESERPYFREFYESVAGGEPFTLDTTLHGQTLGFDTDLRTMQVYIPDSKFRTPRMTRTALYETGFSYRQVS